MTLLRRDRASRKLASREDGQSGFDFNVDEFRQARVVREESLPKRGGPYSGFSRFNSSNRSIKRRFSGLSPFGR